MRRTNGARTGIVLAVLALVMALVGGVVWVGLALWSGATKQPLPLDDQCVASSEDTSVAVTLEQAHNAAIISAVGLRRGRPARAGAQPASGRRPTRTAVGLTGSSRCAPTNGRSRAAYARPGGHGTTTGG